VEQGHARNLRARWQHMDASGGGFAEQQQQQEARPRRQITPPPGDELLRSKSVFEQPRELPLHKAVDTDQELMTIGRGHARSALAR